MILKTKLTITPKNQPIAFLIFTSFLIAACQEEKPPDPGRKLEFTLSLNGDLVDFDESTLGRINQEEEKTIYAVQVFESAENIDETPYAFGLFDQLENASIGLYENRDYRFTTQVFRKGSAFGLYGYYKDDGYMFLEPFWEQYLNNSFRFSTNQSEHNNYGIRYFTNSDSTESAYHYYVPEIDTYYGQANIDLSQHQGDSSIDIETKRTVFGIEAKVENCHEGKVVIRIGGEDQQFELTPENVSLPLKIFSIRDDIDGYEHISLQLNISHVTANSMNVIFDKQITFNRMTIKHLNITLCDECHDQTSAGIRVQLEEKEWDTEVLNIDG